MLKFLQNWEIKELPAIMRIDDDAGRHHEIPFSAYVRKRNVHRNRTIEAIVSHCQRVASDYGGSALEIRVRLHGVLGGYSRIVITNDVPLKYAVYDVPADKTRFKDISLMGSTILTWKI